MTGDSFFSCSQKKSQQEESEEEEEQENAPQWHQRHRLSI